MNVFQTFTKMLRSNQANVNKNVQAGNDQEKAQSERNSDSKNRGGKKNKLTIGYMYT